MVGDGQDEDGKGPEEDDVGSGSGQRLRRATSSSRLPWVSLCRLLSLRFFFSGDKDGRIFKRNGYDGRVDR